MPGWIWLCIWLFLGGLAVAVWGSILARMVRPGAKLQSDLEKLRLLSDHLNAQLSKRPKSAHPEDNLLDDPEQLTAERLALKARRRKRKERRARRLVSRVKDIKLEGRFKDV